MISLLTKRKQSNKKYGLGSLEALTGVGGGGGMYRSQPGNPGIWLYRWKTCCCRVKWRQTSRPRSAGTSPCSASRSISEPPVRPKSGSACTVYRPCSSSSPRRGSRPGHICSWARCSTTTRRTASWPAATWRKRWGALAVGKSGDAAEERPAVGRRQREQLAAEAFKQLGRVCRKHEPPHI